ELQIAPETTVFATLVSGQNPIIGSRIRVAVRPERISMQAGTAPQAANSLSGVVTDAEFLGSVTAYEVRCGTVILEVQSSDSEFAIDQIVTLRIAERDLVVLGT